jgi:hypothetical protein
LIFLTVPVPVVCGLAFLLPSFSRTIRLPSLLFAASTSPDTFLRSKSAAATPRPLIPPNSPPLPTVSPAPKSSNPSSPDSSRRSPKSSRSPRKSCSPKSALRSPSASRAPKKSNPFATGPAPAPSPPTELQTPGYSSARFLRAVFTGLGDRSSQGALRKHGGRIPSLFLNNIIWKVSGYVFLHISCLSARATLIQYYHYY